MMAMYLSFKSLAEIKAIVDHERKWKNSTADSDTFRFYQITLHYMFVMEVCKLMELKIKGEENNIASLKRLNNQVFEIFGDGYKITYQSVQKKLEDLIESEIFIKIKNYRDKKLAHSDVTQNNGPFHFKGLNKNEITDCWELLKKIEEIFNCCISSYDYSFIISQTSKTKNFLISQDEYKSYANSGLKEFLNWKMNIKP